MNTKNSKTNEAHRFELHLVDKNDLKNPNKRKFLINLSKYYSQKNIKSVYNDSKFKISAPAWKDEFELSDGLYSVADIQDYFDYITKDMKLWLLILL